MSEEKRESSLTYYDELFRTCAVIPAWEDRVRKAATTVMQYRANYEDAVSGSIIPWVFPALIHLMECGCDFDRQILNGEPWSRVTKLVPKGEGPWPTWSASTKYALLRYSTRTNWSTAAMLQALELHNGMGYKARGQHSPYLWSGSNHGLGVGKFVKDGTYSPTAVSSQVGCGVVLRVLAYNGMWAEGTEGTATAPLPIQFDADGSSSSITVANFQRGLNLVLRAYGMGVLKDDGWAGKKTSDAAKLIFGSYLIGDDRS